MNHTFQTRVPAPSLLRGQGMPRSIRRAQSKEKGRLVTGPWNVRMLAASPQQEVPVAGCERERTRKLAYR